MTNKTLKYLYYLLFILLGIASIGLIFGIIYKLGIL